MDKPDAPQSVVFCGHATSPGADPDNVAIETMNTILGGDFVSRINMNIRENKHWSYGAQSILLGSRGPRLFLVYAPVQSDKTKETMIEIQNELEGIMGKKPITADEYANARASAVLQLPGRWETMSAVESSLSEIVQYGLPDDYFRKYPSMVMKLKREDLDKAAQKNAPSRRPGLDHRRRPGPDRAENPGTRIRGDPGHRRRRGRRRDGKIVGFIRCFPDECPYNETLRRVRLNRGHGCPPGNRNRFIPPYYWTRPVQLFEEAPNRRA